MKTAVDDIQFPVLYQSIRESSPRVQSAEYIRPSRDSQIMHLLWCLFFIKAHFQIELSISHIQGSDNTQADAISRNQLPLFLSQVPEAEPSPRPMSLNWIGLRPLGHSCSRTIFIQISQLHAEVLQVWHNQILQFLYIL